MQDLFRAGGEVIALYKKAFSMPDTRDSINIEWVALRFVLNGSDFEERLNKWWKKYAKNQEGRKIIRITQIVLACLKHVLTVCSLCLPLPAFVPLITYLTCSRDASNCHDIDQLQEMFKLGFLHYYVEDSKFSDVYKLVYEYDVDYEGDSDFASKAVLIRERNKFAMEVLKATIAAGKMFIAILYGPGNMADFHKRLVQELEMVPVLVSWYTAWSIKGPKSNSSLVRKLSNRE